jgi:hypothetical protein
MTGTIDEIESDIPKIKEMGVNHIFECKFSPIFSDVEALINTSRQFSKFAKQRRIFAD